MDNQLYRPGDGQRSTVGAASRPNRFQFGILPILALMTLVGAVLAALRLTNWPIGIRIGMAAYAIVMLAYISLRVPYLLRQLLGATSDWQKIHADRQQLKQLVEDHRQQRRLAEAEAAAVGKSEDDPAGAAGQLADRKPSDRKARVPKARVPKARVPKARVPKARVPKAGDESSR